MYHKNYSWKWSAISMLINTIDMTNWIWNVCTLLLLSLFQFLKKGKKGFICCFSNHDINCPIKKTTYTVPGSVSWHLCRSNTTKQTQIQLSACLILPLYVVMNWSVSGAGEHTRLPQCMLQDSTKSLQPLCVLFISPSSYKQSCVHVLPHLVDVKCEELSNSATVRPSPKTVKDTK